MIAIHFTDHIAPDAVALDARDVAVRIVHVQTLGHGFFIRMMLPDQEHIVPVGHHFKGMMAHFFAGFIDVVRPDQVAVPIEFLKPTAGAAVQVEFILCRQARGAGQIAVGQQLGGKAQPLAGPRMHHVALLVHQVRVFVFRMADQHIAGSRFRLVLEHAKKAFESLISSGGRGQNHRHARRQQQGTDTLHMSTSVGFYRCSGQLRPRAESRPPKSHIVRTESSNDPAATESEAPSVWAQDFGSTEPPNWAHCTAQWTNPYP